MINIDPKKQNIILYNPKAVFYDMPLALIAIGSQVYEDYNVIIIDARIDHNEEELLNKYLPNSLLVGITSLTGAPLKDAINFTKNVKAKKPTIPIIWGGWHTSLFPEQVLEEIVEVDVCVQGQGETTFKELVSAYSSDADVRSVKGITYRNEDKEIVKTAPRAMVDMNDLPRLNYDLIDVERYFEAKGRRQFDYIASTGCFFRCTFCADPFVFQRKFTGLEADKMHADLMHYHNKYKFDDVNFQDETFFTYPKNILALSEKLIDSGSLFSWAATMRADQGNRLTEDDFKTCQDSGLRRLLIGVESGSQEMMDWLKKDIKMEHVLLCADRCARLGIAVIFPFIIGFPGESDKSVEASKLMIRDLSRMSSKFDTPVFYFKPYPGTKITQDVVDSGEFVLPSSINDWAEFDYIGSKGPWVSDDKFKTFERYKFYLKLYRKRNSTLLKPISYIAKKRIDRFYFGFPFEKTLANIFYKEKDLS